MGNFAITCALSLEGNWPYDILPRKKLEGRRRQNVTCGYDVTGKVVFITGAGRGIGKGIAQGLAAAGADAVLNALTPRYVENTAAEIAEDTGRRVMLLLVDVTKADYDWADSVSGWRIKPVNGMSNQPAARTLFLPR